MTQQPSKVMFHEEGYGHRKRRVVEFDRPLSPEEWTEVGAWWNRLRWIEENIGNPTIYYPDDEITGLVTYTLGQVDTLHKRRRCRWWRR